MSGPGFGSDNRGLVLSRRVVRQASQLGFVALAGILLVIAAYRLTSLWLVPEVTVAIRKSDAEFVGLFTALARKTDPTLLEIHVREVADAEAVDAALKDKTADFAVVRPDIDFPASAQVAAVLQDNAFFVIAPEQTKILRADQLAGKRVGLVGIDARTRETLKRVLEFHQAAGVQMSDLGAEPAEIKAAFAAKRIDAIALSGSPMRLRQIVNGLSDLKPHLVPLGASDLSQAFPTLGSATIAAKSLPGGVPDEEVQTVSTRTLLVARRDVDRATVNAFLQSLFSLRPSLAAESAVAWQAKGPEDDSTFAKLPNHRGALDYYNREQQTFMDLYGDWIWLALFAAGGFSSAGAWLTQTLSRRRKQLVENVLDRLLEILGEARDATDIETLDRLTREIDGLVTHAIRQARWRANQPVTTSALTLAIDSSRAAIADRRRALVMAQVRTPSEALRASP